MVSENHSSENPWGNFRSYDPCQLGFQQSKNVKIDFVFKVQVSPIQDQHCSYGFIHDIYGRFAVVKLYQYLSYFLANHAVIHLGLMRSYPSLDKQEYAERRLKLSEAILYQAKSYEIVGNLHWITDTIREITERGEK